MGSPEFCCPHCKKKIDLLHIKWVCPACNASNLTSAFENCDHCRFSPRLLPCQFCGRWIETSLVVGSFNDSCAGIFPTAEYPIRTITKNRVVDLEFSAIGALGDDDFAPLVKYGLQEILKKVFELEFELPYRVEKIVLHTIHCTSEINAWLHCWLYKERATGPPVECQAQISLHCDLSGTEPVVKGIITDVQMAY